MPITIPTPVTRYFQPGLTAVVMLPTVAAFSTTGPTLAELGASTDVSADVADVNGFTTSVGALATPDWGSRGVGSVPGRITYDDSSLVLYASATGADARAIFTQDQNCFIGFYGNGRVTGSAADYYKVTVASVSRMRATEDVTKLQINFVVRAVKEGLLYPIT